MKLAMHEWEEALAHIETQHLKSTIDYFRGDYTRKDFEWPPSLQEFLRMAQKFQRQEEIKRNEEYWSAPLGQLHQKIENNERWYQNQQKLWKENISEEIQKIYEDAKRKYREELENINCTNNDQFNLRIKETLINLLGKGLKSS